MEDKGSMYLYMAVGEEEKEEKEVMFEFSRRGRKA